MKVALLLMSFTFAFQSIYSQALENIETIDSESSTAQKTSLILNLGMGFPSGNYADKEEGGAAKNGFNIGVDFQYNATESFYVGAMYRNQSNPFNEPSMHKWMSDAVAYSIALGQMPPGYSVQSTSTEGWKINSYLFGVGTISDLNNESIKFYTKMMLGLCSSSSPSTQAMVTNSSNNYIDFTINLQSDDAINFAALFGLGLRIDAGETVDFFVSGDYFTSSLEFEDVRMQMLGLQSEPIQMEQEVDIMSLTFGLVFKL